MVSRIRLTLLVIHGLVCCHCCRKRAIKPSWSDCVQGEGSLLDRTRRLLFKAAVTLLLAVQKEEACLVVLFQPEQCPVGPNVAVCGTSQTHVIYTSVGEVADRGAEAELVRIADVESYKVKDVWIELEVMSPVDIPGSYSIAVVMYDSLEPALSGAKLPGEKTHSAFQVQASQSITASIVGSTTCPYVHMGIQRSTSQCWSAMQLPGLGQGLLKQGQEQEQRQEVKSPVANAPLGRRELDLETSGSVAAATVL